MDDTLFQTRAVATDREGDRLRPSLNWVVARRAALTLYRDRLTCGDWALLYAGFERAELVSIRGGFASGLALVVWHGGRVYQFRPYSRWGIRPHPFWAGLLPFPAERVTRTPEPASAWLTGG